MHITRNFTTDEMACSCCGKADMDEEFMKVLQSIRDEMQRPLKITSGYRCQEHNLKIGGRVGSSHLKGLAADLSYNGSRERYLILNALIQVGINRIGIAKTFIHVDMADRLEGEDKKVEAVFWLY